MDKISFSQLNCHIIVLKKTIVCLMCSYIALTYNRKTLKFTLSISIDHPVNNTRQLIIAQHISVYNLYAQSSSV